MNESSLTFGDILGILRRHLVTLGLSMAIGLALALVALAYLSEKYKSQSVINIQASYFASGLASDVLPQITDPAEQSAQRLALVRYALNEPFLDFLGEEYHLFKGPSGEANRVLERENLLKMIEYYPNSTTTVFISTTAPTAQIALSMNRDVLNQLIEVFVRERRKNLARARDSLRRRVDELTVFLATGVGPDAAVQPADAKNELEKLQIDINALTAQFSAVHPEVIRLKERARTLEGILSSGSQKAKQSNRANDLAFGSAARAPTKEVYDDLVKKLNYLSLVIDMESDNSNLGYISVIENPALASNPVFPPRFKILLLGLAGGTLWALMIVAVRECKQDPGLVPLSLAGILKVPLVGELPAWRSNERLPELPAPGEEAQRLALPLLPRES